MTTLKLPPGLSANNILAWGLSSIVFLDKDSSEVIKVPRGLKERPEIEVEKQIYERLSEDGQHCGLLKYLGCEPFDEGSAWAIHLEYAAEGQLSIFLKKKLLSHEELDTRIRWISQLGNTLNYLHSKHIVHGDISCNNIFLDQQLNTKLGDFAGSSIDGSICSVACSSSHDAPRPMSPKQADIFALGSVYYHIMTGFPPYHGLPGYEIKTLYEQGQFPETESLKWIGNIIRGCWIGRYANMDDVIRDIDMQGTGSREFFLDVELILPSLKNPTSAHQRIPFLCRCLSASAFMSCGFQYHIRGPSDPRQTQSYVIPNVDETMNELANSTCTI